MEIPTTFEIFGEKIKVKIVKKLNFNESAVGMTYHRKGLIEIQDSTEAWPISKDSMEQTFFHELMHLVLKKLSYDELSSDENFAERMGNALQQVFKTMKTD